MSTGPGRVQRDLLDALRRRPGMAAAARDLVAEMLEGLPAMEATRRRHATDVAVRRALRGLAEAGLVVEVGRRGPGVRSTRVVYAAEEPSGGNRQMPVQAEPRRRAATAPKTGGVAPTVGPSHGDRLAALMRDVAERRGG